MKMIMPLIEYTYTHISDSRMRNPILNYLPIIQTLLNVYTCQSSACSKNQKDNGKKTIFKKKKKKSQGKWKKRKRSKNKYKECKMKN